MRDTAVRDPRRSGPRAGVLSFWAIVLVIVALAAALRLSHLTTKVYGFDETVTSVRVSGRTLREFDRRLDTRSSMPNEEVRAFLGRHGDRPASATIVSLATEDPQHPPLYYLAEREWEGVAGTSVFARRALAAAFGVALAGAVIWLAFELFGSRRVALVAGALVAVSPLHVWYSQQSREYSLWALDIVVATGLLIVALRGNDRRVWAAYALAAAASLYTFPLSLAVLAAHGGSVAMIRPGRERAIRFIISLGLALIAFAPWAAVLVVQRDVAGSTTTWLSTALPLRLMAAKWAFGAASVFVDGEYADARWMPAAIVTLLAVIVAIVALVRSADRRAATLVLWIAAASALVLIVPDLLRHESRSTAARYLLPTWIALELVLAAWIARPGRFGRVRALLGAAIVSFGVASCLHALPLTAWWPDTSDAPLAAMVPVVAAAPRPNLVVPPQDYYALELVNSGAPNATLSREPVRERQNFTIAGGDTEALLQRRFTLRPIELAGTIDRSGLVTVMRRDLAAARGSTGGGTLELWRVETTR